MDRNDSTTQAPAKRRAWRSSVESLVPTIAVVTVVVTALLATVMVTYSERQASREVAVSPAPRANALGAGSACVNCGVVESAAANRQPGGYRIRVRMDDGTVRTVEHRGSLPAGARVLLEGGTVRVMAGQS